MTDSRIGEEFETHLEMLGIILGGVSTLFGLKPSETTRKRKAQRLGYSCILMHSSPSPARGRRLILSSLRGTRGVNRTQSSNVPPAACLSSPGAAEKVKKPVYGGA